VAELPLRDLVSGLPGKLKLYVCRPHPLDRGLVAVGTNIGIFVLALPPPPGPPPLAAHPRWGPSCVLAASALGGVIRHTLRSPAMVAGSGAAASLRRSGAFTAGAASLSAPVDIPGGSSGGSSSSGRGYGRGGGNLSSPQRDDGGGGDGGLSGSPGRSPGSPRRPVSPTRMAMGGQRLLRSGRQGSEAPADRSLLPDPSGRYVAVLLRAAQVFVLYELGFADGSDGC
ncbi:unnamed protein product, partial [Phaeothamnion confervicola]